MSWNYKPGWQKVGESPEHAPSSQQHNGDIMELATNSMAVQLKTVEVDPDSASKLLGEMRAMRKKIKLLRLEQETLQTVQGKIVKLTDSIPGVYEADRDKWQLLQQ